jgi:hypothetical protein
VVSVVDDAQIVSYLLGDLAEEERTRLEERFLRDAEYRELIRAVEDDLIDDYVRGELPPHQRELFEKQFSAHPQRAQKVELARALSRALSEPRPAVKTVSIAARAAKTRVRAPISGFRYPLAAAAVLIIGLGVWLVMETRRSRPEGEQTQTQQQTPAPAEKPPTGPGERPTPAPQLWIATFVLPPGLVRDGAAGRTFVIPQGTQIVRLRLPLEKGDDFPSYRAELGTASGNSVWKSDSVPAQTDGAGQAVVLDVPADLLRPDRYELRLAGVNQGVAEDIGYYYFSFARQ